MCAQRALIVSAARFQCCVHVERAAGGAECNDTEAAPSRYSRRREGETERAALCVFDSRATGTWLVLMLMLESALVARWRPDTSSQRERRARDMLCKARTRKERERAQTSAVHRCVIFYSYYTDIRVINL